MPKPGHSHGTTHRKLDSHKPSFSQLTILSHKLLRVPCRGVVQARQAGTVLTGAATTERPRWGHLDSFASLRSLCRFPQGLQQRNDRLWCQILVVVVVDLHHRRIDTGTQAFNFDVRKQAVLGGVAGGDAQVVVDGFNNLVTAAATQLAWCLLLLVASMT